VTQVIHKVAPRYWRWWRGVVGNSFRLKRNYSTVGPVSTAMGDCLPAGMLLAFARPVSISSNFLLAYHIANLKRAGVKESSNFDYWNSENTLYVCMGVAVSKEVVGMSCGFRDACGCGYQFISSNVNLVWKRRLRAPNLQTSGMTDIDDETPDTNKHGGINALRLLP